MSTKDEIDGNAVRGIFDLATSEMDNRLCAGAGFIGVYLDRPLEA